VLREVYESYVLRLDVLVLLLLGSLVLLLTGFIAPVLVLVLVLGYEASGLVVRNHGWVASVVSELLVRSLMVEESCGLSLSEVVCLGLVFGHALYVVRVWCFGWKGTLPVVAIIIVSETGRLCQRHVAGSCLECDG
jgi:hypothetical protein